jgi:hypothetical protein
VLQADVVEHLIYKKRVILIFSNKNTKKMRRESGQKAGAAGRRGTAPNIQNSYYMHSI